MNWQVYILSCADGTLYTGITTDIARRQAQHVAGRGARYLRGRAPLRLVYLESGHDRSSASRREAQIKRLRLAEKRLLIGAALAPAAADPHSRRCGSAPALDSDAAVGHHCQPCTCEKTDI